MKTVRFDVTKWCRVFEFRNRTLEIIRVRKNNILRCVDLGKEIVVTMERHYHGNEPTARRYVLSIWKLAENGP